MSQKSRGVVQDDDVQELAGHFPPQARGQLPDQLSSILTGDLLVDEHSDIKIAVLAASALRTTTEKKAETNSRDLGERLGEASGGGIGISSTHTSTVPYARGSVQRRDVPLHDASPAPRIVSITLVLFAGG